MRACITGKFSDYWDVLVFKGVFPTPISRNLSFTCFKLAILATVVHVLNFFTVSVQYKVKDVV